MELQPIISIENIVKKLNNKNILNGVSLSVNEGEIFGIIGQSGSGKTVLFKTIAGFYRYDEGNITIQSDRRQSIQQMLGFSAQNNRFYPNLTTKENLFYFGTIFNLKRSFLKTKIQSVLKLVELEDAIDTKASELSGGMQRRLDFALALLHNPHILLLDEPTSGLDPILRMQILNLIQEIRNRGTTIIIASHFVEEIEPISDRIGILKQGRIIISGTPKFLRERFSHIYEINIRSYPGSYENILHLTQRKFPIISYSINRTEIKLIVSQDQTTDYYLNNLTAILKNLNEALLTIKIDKSPFKDIFETIIKDDNY